MNELNKDAADMSASSDNVSLKYSRGRERWRDWQVGRVSIGDLIADENDGSGAGAADAGVKGERKKRTGGWIKEGGDSPHTISFSSPLRANNPRVHLIQQSKSDFDTQSRYEGSREVALILPPTLAGQSFLADFLALPMLPCRISVKLISRGWI